MANGLDRLWEQLIPAEQARIVRSLLERMVVGPADAIAPYGTGARTGHS